MLKIIIFPSNYGPDKKVKRKLIILPCRARNEKQQKPPVITWARIPCRARNEKQQKPPVITWARIRQVLTPREVE